MKIEHIIEDGQGSLQNSGALYLEDEEGTAGLQLDFWEGQLPRISYWGEALPIENLRPLKAVLNPQRVSGALDETSWPSILPTQSEAWTGSKRFVARRGGVEIFPHFTVTDIATDEGGGEEVRCSAVHVSASDDELGVSVFWTLEMLRGGAVRQRMTVTNSSEHDHEPLEIGKVELAFPVPSSMSVLESMTGHHLRERSAQRQPFTFGRFEKVSLVGRPDFDSCTLLSAGREGFGFEQGTCYSVHVGWSGNGFYSAEKTPYTTGLLGGGEELFGGEMILKKGESYETPWLYGSFGEGMNAVGHRFHRYVRAMHPSLLSKPRPVTLNTWEAVYFNQSYEKLKTLATLARDSGIERFVVDDGWFRGRRDDTSALGDWQVDNQVWPEGLGPLADYVHSLGMEFGLWFEPEMISPDSQVARQHPEWILRPTPHRLPMQGRDQQVIDLSNPQAFDYIRESMRKLVSDLSIDYIKWDHNKMVTEAVSPTGGLPCVHSQTMAVYAIFDWLKEQFPSLEIETCSSGGGRIDLGILDHADRVWVSDCVDPVERLDIQRYTSLLVPPEMMGEHIGDSPAHSTDRSTSLTMRAATAFFGHLGVEWDLTRVGPSSLETLKEWITVHKEYRSLFSYGTVVHGDAIDAAIRLDGVVSADGNRALYRFAQVTTSQYYPAAPVHLPGLEDGALYLVRPLRINEDLTDIGNGQSALLWWNEAGVQANGRTLRRVGIRPPQINPEQAVLFEAVRL
ncbi:MAG: alpha-galactosidase [Bifidobacteriaceae bacterium]|jgi:alpha-galactosidase|nr:alpha-galactosidase [Bifidobacteriaceae bacterium]MCI1979462.1 alpha-galactosidase [Bifidobacteriaceae bacterium]